MIFSRLLKKKWQSKDENVRIQSVNELDVKTDKDILFSLLKNDDSAKVKISILEKFDDLSLWLEALKDKKNKQVKKRAQSVIESHLLCESHNCEISTEVKFQIADDISNTKFFERWLAVESKTNVIITLLEKINKPAVLNSYFGKTQDADVLSYIVDREDRQTELTKLKKLCANQDVSVLIDQKLSKLNVNEITKVELNKRIQLVLAKLLNLNAYDDLKLFLSQLDELNEEWTLLTESFDLLTIREKDKFVNKYQELTAKLNVTQAQLEEQSIQTEIAQKAKLALEESAKEIEIALDKMQEGIRKAIHESFVIDTKVFENEVQSLKQKIESSKLNSEEQKTLLMQLRKINEEACLVDNITGALEIATQALAKISQVAVPSDLEGFEEKYQLLRDLEQTWESSVKPYIKYVPSPLVEAKVDISKRWKAASSPLFKEQKVKLNKAKSKLKNVNQLIDSGKFNPAFGVFKSASRLVDDLNDKQKQLLEKDLQLTKARLDEISDWEHYVSTPKKIDLLKQVSELVENPKKDLKVQADQVKSFRQQWNKLGHADSDKERELNEAFNLACEDAFAPCREFFAAQEQKRDDNLKSRKLLISELNTFIDGSLEQANEKELSTQIKSFNQKWKVSGEIDRKVFETINTEYRDLFSQLKIRQHELQTENANRKRTLVEEAKSLLTLDNREAVNKVKQLQNEWKQIGFAGNSLEKSLWHSFRQVNDEIFEARSQALSNKNKETAIVADTYTKLIHELKADFDNSVSKQSLKELVDRLRVTFERFKSEAHQPKSLLNELNELKSRINEKAKDEAQDAKRKELILLFNVLEIAIEKKIALSEVSEFEQLTNQWKKRLISIDYDDASESRREKETVALEVIFNAQSPVDESEIRRQVQVELMQEQMSTGAKPTPEKLLTEWLEKGALSNNDSHYLSRVKQLFS